MTFLSCNVERRCFTMHPAIDGGEDAAVAVQRRTPH